MNLPETLRLHALYLGGHPDGVRADLSGACLSRADLSGACLSRADLSGADLYDACLSGADLRGADLSEADLSRADLSGADLSGADLSGSGLSGADLRDADLSDANLHGADLSGARLLDALVPLDRLTAKVPRQSPPVTREEIYRAIVGSADPYNLEESIGIMHSRRVAAMVDRVYALIEGATP
jgi:hypothetical protein